MELGDDIFGDVFVWVDAPGMMMMMMTTTICVTPSGSPFM